MPAYKFCDACGRGFAEGRVWEDEATLNAAALAAGWRRTAPFDYCPGCVLAASPPCFRPSPATVPLPMVGC